MEDEKILAAKVEFTAADGVVNWTKVAAVVPGRTDSVVRSRLRTLDKRAARRVFLKLCLHCSCSLETIDRLQILSFSTHSNLYPSTCACDICSCLASFGRAAVVGGRGRNYRHDKLFLCLSVKTISCLFCRDAQKSAAGGGRKQKAKGNAAGGSAQPAKQRRRSATSTPEEATASEESASEQPEELPLSGPESDGPDSSGDEVLPVSRRMAARARGAAQAEHPPPHTAEQQQKKGGAGGRGKPRAPAAKRTAAALRLGKGTAAKK